MTPTLANERSQIPFIGVHRTMRSLTCLGGPVLAALLVVSAAFMPTAASGQDAATRPIFLALPDQFPDLGARVVLVREPGREIVVLDPASATADELIIGLRLLNRARRERGAPTNGEVIPVLGFYPPTLSVEERSRLEAIIAELRQRPVANVGSLGPGRWMRYLRS